MKPRKQLSSGAACLLALAAAQAAHAATTVTVSGSTLFASFFTASAAGTNDFIDVNNNGVFAFMNGNVGGYSVEQLAPVATFSGNGGTVSYASTTSTILQTPQWNLQYRSVGSVNGLQEMLNTQAGLANPWIPLNFVSQAFVNQTIVVNNGAALYTSSDPNSGVPTAISAPGADIAVLDVPSKWGLQVSGSAAWNLKPTAPGYGTNAANSSTGFPNLLVNRTVNGITFNNNTSSPDAHTMFDTAIAAAPINIVANPGAGITQIRASDLQTLYVTGRMPNGEHLQALTRSVDSGTRNGAMNSIGVDPSFGVGENLGNEVTGLTYTQLGASYQPGNYNGSGDMESGLTNTRLGIGYDGSDRSTSKSGSKWGSVMVMFDTLGGTQYVTPSVSTIVDNSDVNNGWRMGGIETFVTVGDPGATAINTNYPALNSNPQMANAAGAAYIRNITESIKAYNGAPTSDNTLFMPADYLSSAFVLTTATQLVQSPTDATTWVPNPNFNAAVSSQALANATFNAKLVSSPTVAAGVVPTRNSSATPYTDNSTTGAYTYYDNTGAAFQISGGATLNMRNKIAGDFNNTGVRDINQIPQMMAAIANPVAWAQTNNSGAAGAGLGTAAIPEILGDFNGDGNFDASDVHYFADGLAIATSGPHAGNLDRKAGFIAVDTHWTVGTAGHPAGNYFNTTLATGKTYAAGDSRGNLTGPVMNATIGAADIDYLAAQIRKATGQSSATVPTVGNDPNLDVNGAFSTLLTRAAANPAVDVTANLSADMTGDLMINSDDMNELVLNILGTLYGDANLDGHVTFADFLDLQNNYNKAGGWAQGDWNGDGQVTFADFLLLQNNYNKAGSGFGGGAVLPASAPQPSSAPEPASLALLGLGLVLLAGRARKA